MIMMNLLNTRMQCLKRFDKIEKIKNKQIQICTLWSCCSCLLSFSKFGLESVESVQLNLLKTTTKIHKIFLNYMIKKSEVQCSVIGHRFLYFDFRICLKIIMV